MIKVVITDLDNTLYNWVDYYVPSFNAMVSELAKLTGIDEKNLRSSFKRVHEKYRTTEYAFSIQELDVLQQENALITTPEILMKYNSAIASFRAVRKETLRLYPGIMYTLEALRSKNRRIIAHTDSMMFYAVYRIKQLGIESLLDGLVATKDHGFPTGTRPEDVRKYDDPGRYVSNISYKVELDPSVMKPDKKGICTILNDYDIDADEAVYVGDSLHKDIYMAQQSGVHDVYASYGRSFDENNYRQLVEITHWTDEDVDRESKSEESGITPTFTISRSSEFLEVIRSIESR